VHQNGAGNSAVFCSPASPRQIGFAERLIGSIPRECLDHIVVLGEAHLRRILRSCARYYNDIRTHRSLDKDTPAVRPLQRAGSISSHAILGGLHHHYVRVRAGRGGPSTFLHFFLVPAVDLGRPVETAPAASRELYRTANPIPDLKPGGYDLNLTRVTFPAQMPSNLPHHRSGAALYYVVSGTGANTIDGKAILRLSIKKEESGLRDFPR